MAQQVVIAGAMFEDVPQISVPDANNVYHPFLDTTIASNAAAAGDIAQGKLAYVNGSLVTGTNQGGGGGAVKVGALRPDAVLDTSWTYDKLIHANEGVTIPSYSTSEQTLKASAALVTNKQLDNTQYDYIVTYRGIVAPVYSSSSKGAGKFIYSTWSWVNEIVCVPSSYVTVDSATSDRYANTYSIIDTRGTCVYWRNSSAIRAVSAISYGMYFTSVAPTFSQSTIGTPTITINSPKMSIKGSSTYLSSTYWNYITDIRYQYIVELWKVPRTGDVKGFAMTSQLIHATQCAQSATGKLT